MKRARSDVEASFARAMRRDAWVAVLTDGALVLAAIGVAAVFGWVVYRVAG